MLKRAGSTHICIFSTMETRKIIRVFFLYSSTFTSFFINGRVEEIILKLLRSSIGNIFPNTDAMKDLFIQSWIQRLYQIKNLKIEY